MWVVWLILLCPAISFRISKVTPFSSSIPLKCTPNLIVGLNKYSHDAGCCIVDASTGKILFAQTKERYSRKKHDGGDCSLVIRHGLRSVGATLNDVKLVVSNNHHYRVSSFEKRLPFTSAIDHLPDSYMSLHNLLPRAIHLELSHHLAHAWSAISTAPFDNGLVVVMDGMGESYHSMLEDMKGVVNSTREYIHDLKLMAQSASQLVNIPSDMHSSGSRFREAESAYWFDASIGKLQPVFKRWTRERAPPELFNGGFEHMESLGAVYSRISSHIFGDWNACGKVMGLSGWTKRSDVSFKNWPSPPLVCSDDPNEEKDASERLVRLFTGNPMNEKEFQVHWETIDSLPHVNQFDDPSNFPYYAKLAESVQNDLTASALKLLTSLQRLTTAENAILTGGVALNSVLNGAIFHSGIFRQFHVPCAPGDEGIPVGCALYGYHHLKRQEHSGSTSSRILQQKSNAYQGSIYSEDHIVAALKEVRDWVTIEAVFDNDEELVSDAAQMLSQNRLVAWWQGRAELGQRALGSRSLLGSPADSRLRSFVNAKVKGREWFRPLAPSVLADHVSDWFECPHATLRSPDCGHGNESNISPFMSVTLKVKEEKQPLVPAVVHIDQTARLQTVTVTDNSLFHALLGRFYSLTKLPMLLNTSLNGKDKPIVETPLDALQLFLSSAGSIDVLYLGKYKVTLKPLPVPWDKTLSFRHSTMGDAMPDETDYCRLSLSQMKKLQVKLTSQCYLQERVSSSARRARGEQAGNTVKLRLWLNSPFQSVEDDAEDSHWVDFADVFTGELLLEMEDLVSSSAANTTVNLWTLWRRLLIRTGFSPLHSWSEAESALWQQLHRALRSLHYEGYIALS